LEWARAFISRSNREEFTSWVRFSADVADGVPSKIVVGIFAYAIVVRTFAASRRSRIVALAPMMVPLVTSAQPRRWSWLVPPELREASLALAFAMAHDALGGRADGALKESPPAYFWRSRDCR